MNVPEAVTALPDICMYIVLADAKYFSNIVQAEPHGLKAAQPALGLQKNPETDTSFLPDRERAQHEEEVRKQVEREYELQDQVGPDPSPLWCRPWRSLL